MKPESRMTNLRPAFAAVTGLIVVAMLFSLAPVQAAALDFLDLFRVKRFTAITLDRERLEQLQSGNFDVEAILGDNVEVLKEAGPPRTFSDRDLAAQAAGIPLRVPGWLPAGMDRAPEFLVQDSSSMRFTVDGELVAAALEMLNITDVKLPEALNGAEVTVHAPPAVSLHYFQDGSANGNWDSLTVIQAQSPEIDLPDGVNMADLGLIGLRIAGMEPDEARQYAATIDWNSTLVIPIPANAATFQEIGVRGQSGLLITSAEGGRGTSEVVLLWAEGDLVYAVLASNAEIALQVAESLK